VLVCCIFVNSKWGHVEVHGESVSGADEGAAQRDGVDCGARDGEAAAGPSVFVCLWRWGDVCVVTGGCEKARAGAKQSSTEAEGGKTKNSRVGKLTQVTKASIKSLKLTSSY